MAANTKKHRNDSPTTTGRKPRLTPTARAQAQRDAFARRVLRRAAHVIRYTALPKPDEERLSWENFPHGLFLQEVTKTPVRGINRVTGLPY